MNVVGENTTNQTKKMLRTQHKRYREESATSHSFSRATNMKHNNNNNNNNYNYILFNNTRKGFYSTLSIFFMLFIVISTCNAKINTDKESEVKYVVNIKDWPVSNEVRKQAEIDSTHYEMTSSGDKYDYAESSTRPVSTPTSLEIDSVLSSLSSSCIMKLDGWWTYEFCYHKHISQFHQPKETDKIEQLYYLGLYKEDSPAGEIKNLKEDRPAKGYEIADLPYYSEIYEDGTPCEIPPFTPRKTEVRYYCHEQKTNIISDHREPSTCNYVVNIFTQHLCSFLAFKPVSSPVQKVECFIRRNEL